MKENTYSTFENKKNDIQIILEYPNQPDNETMIRKEVQSILTNMIQEHLSKVL